MVEFEPNPAVSAARQRRRRSGVLRLIRPFLGVPLFYKIIVANAVLAVLAVPFLRDGQWGVLLLFLILNVLLVHTALIPLRRIEATARRIAEGDLAARVPASVLADHRIERLTELLNQMVASLVEGRERRAELAARVMEAEEVERKRLAAELFDDTSQHLSSVLLRLQLARRMLDGVEGSASAGISEVLEAARSDAQAALGGIRRVARGLRPPELDEIGVVAAIEAYARQLTEQVGIRVRVEGDPVDRWLSTRGALVLYRVVQEALVNAVRHSRADEILIRFTLEPERVRAEVEDAGRGFATDEVLARPGRSVGLMRMYERARYADGELEIASSPGFGTHVTLLLPRLPLRREGRPLPLSDVAVDEMSAGAAGASTPARTAPSGAGVSTPAEPRA